MKLTTIIVFILSFICTTVSAQMLDLKWAKQIGSSNYEEPSGIDFDKNGNVYTVGNFHSTCDFDPGTGVYNLTCTSSNIFIQKLDSNGLFITAKCFQGNAYCFLRIKVDPSGNLFLYGNFYNTVDFDLGPGIYNLNSSISKAVILKLDSAWNFKWVKTFGTNSEGFVSSIDLDSSGNIYATGSFSGSTWDCDPGPGVLNLSSQGSTDIFVLKLDSSGSLLWSNSIGGTGTDQATNMDVDSSGNIYLTGDFSDTVDFNPGSGTSYFSSAGFTDGFVLALTTSGNYKWCKAIAGLYFYNPAGLKVASTNEIYFNSYGSIGKIDSTGNIIWLKTPKYGEAGGFTGLDVDRFGNVYSIGNYSFITTDFDLGLGTYFIASALSSNIYICKLDALGNFIWAAGFLGNNNEQSKYVRVDQGGNVYSCGFFTDLFDADPGASVLNMTSAGSLDGYVLKLKQGPCANFSANIDSLKLIDCTNFQGYASCKPLHGVTPYSYSWNTIPVSTDSFIVVGHTGIYQLTTTDANNCVSKNSVVVSGPKYQQGFDLNVNLYSGLVNPLFPVYVQINAFNDACTSASGTLKLIMDTGSVTFQSATPPPTAINGDTLIWDFSGIDYYSAHLSPIVMFSLSPTIVLGDRICFEAIITPTAADNDTSNNSKTICAQIVGSYDPNYKAVYPQGNCEEGFVLSDNLFTYSLHFQNTGTWLAYNILVTDSLSQNLDLSTLRVIESSHPYELETSGNVIGFRFNNILLPDSGSNEPLSHGYIVFEINSVGNIASGIEIKNKANIYFDSNPPVITNEVLNTIVNTLPSCITKLDQVSNNPKLISVFPNPTSSVIHVKTQQDGDLIFFDIYGVQLMKYKTHNKQCTIDVSMLKAGLYFIKTPDGTYSKIIRN